jgi:hypothetical protein
MFKPQPDIRSGVGNDHSRDSVFFAPSADFLGELCGRKLVTAKIEELPQRTQSNPALLTLPPN